MKSKGSLIPFWATETEKESPIGWDGVQAFLGDGYGGNGYGVRFAVQFPAFDWAQVEEPFTTGPLAL